MSSGGPFGVKLSTVDTVQKFGDYLGQSGGNSYIYTNIVRTLDMGVQIVGVVTDLESYPSTDVDSLAGKKYENVSLTFYLTRPRRQL